MSKQREELDSALEALQNKMRETISKLDPNEMVWIHQPPGGCKRENVRMSKQREAMKQALHALQTKGEHHRFVYDAMKALAEALAEPEPKPVVWIRHENEWVGLAPKERLPIETPRPDARKPLSYMEACTFIALNIEGGAESLEMQSQLVDLIRAVERAHGITND